MRDYLKPRSNMIESQLRPNRVTDGPVLESFRAVPRELFVPERLHGAAYSDEALPLGQGRFLLEPLVLARLLQAAAIRPGDAVLDIACGTGYAAALLGRLARTVTAVESDPALLGAARAALRAADAQNVSLIEAPFAEGYAPRAPYDVILIEGTVGAVPPALLAQLADGGRLIGIVAAGRDDAVPAVAPALAEAVLMTRLPSGIATRVLFETGARDLPGLCVEPAFTF